MKYANTLCYLVDKITTYLLDLFCWISQWLTTGLDLNNDGHIKNNHYDRIYDELPEPVVFIPVVVSTSGRIHEEFLLLLFLHTNREVSLVAGELPEESFQLHFIWTPCLVNLKAISPTRGVL